MRWTLLGMVAVVAVGCGATETRKPPPFSLDAPAKFTLLKADTQTMDVPVKWDNGEREALDVTVVLEPADRGVTARPVRERLESGVSPAQVTLAATETAAPGDYELTVKLKGVSSGKTAEAKVKIEVPRGD